MAGPVIEDIWARGALPVVCGGTGLYLKVLMEGIAPVPEVPRETVTEAETLLAETGGEAFLEALREIDPDAAETLQPGDRQRLVRAYSVWRATGRPLSAWRSEQAPGPMINGRFLKIVFALERERLYARIEARFETMVAAGALEEVAALQPLALDPALPALKALGVPEFRRHLDGECELSESIDKAKQLTRNFAKRQTTWFRGQMAADVVTDRFGAEALDDVLPVLEDFLQGSEPE